MNAAAKPEKCYSLLNELPVGVCVVNRELTVLFWNVNLACWLGIDAQDITGKKLDTLFARFADKRYRARIDQVFEGGAPEVFSSQLHKSLFWPVQDHVKPYVHQTVVTALARPDGNGNDALISVTDVTELTQRTHEQRLLKETALAEIERRKAVEQELLASKKALTELNATKDRLFSVIAHDLRAPLSSIINFTSLMADSPSAFSPAEVHSCLHELHEGAENILALLENLLDWARSQMGQFSFEPADFVLREIVASCMKLLQNTAAEKRIDIMNDIPATCTIHGDANMIKTCFRNLLANAIKFTKPGGSVTIRHIRDFSGENGTPFAEIAVEDTGIGIRPERLASLFSLEASRSSTGTAGETGTGLGLLLCREFIDRNGGSIRAESQLDRGSRFIMTLVKARTRMDHETTAASGEDAVTLG